MIMKKIIQLEITAIHYESTAVRGNSISVGV